MKTPKTLADMARRGEDNRFWYVTAHAQLLALQAYIKTDRRCEWPVSSLADIFAIFSPRVQVTRNIRDALWYINRTAPNDDSVPPVKAVWTHHTELDPIRFRIGMLGTTKKAMKHWEKTGEVRGPKTSAFSRALQLDPNAVVLDVWMARALDIPDKFTKAQAREGTRRIIRTASLLNWSPAETQAAIWMTAIRWSPQRRINPTPYLIMPEVSHEHEATTPKNSTPAD